MKVQITEHENGFFIELNPETDKEQVKLARLGSLSRATDESQIQTVFRNDETVYACISIKKNKKRSASVYNRKFKL